MSITIHLLTTHSVELDKGGDLAFFYGKTDGTFKLIKVVIL